jgi:hypothetical protein
MSLVGHIEYVVCITLQNIKMEKEFIPYEQVLALKELGFNETSLGFYYDEKGNIFYNSLILSYLEAPLYQQAFRWFREKYEYDSDIRPFYRGGYAPHIYNSPSDIWNDGKDYVFKTYEEAELECLKKLIEIVKEQK